MSNAMHARMKRELGLLAREPPVGVCGWPVGDAVNALRAQIADAGRASVARFSWEASTRALEAILRSDP